MAFNGYLIKATSADAPFPNKYIAKLSWNTVAKSSVIKEYKEENTGNLHRIMAANKKAEISFNTTNLTYSQKIEVVNYFKNATTDTVANKIELQYWDSESESYKTGTFYYEDLSFNINYITPSRTVGSALSFTFKEY